MWAKQCAAAVQVSYRREWGRRRWYSSAPPFAGCFTGTGVAHGQGAPQAHRPPPPAPAEDRWNRATSAAASIGQVTRAATCGLAKQGPWHRPRPDGARRGPGVDRKLAGSAVAAPAKPGGKQRKGGRRAGMSLWAGKRGPSVGAAGGLASARRRAWAGGAPRAPAGAGGGVAGPFIGKRARRWEGGARGRGRGVRGRRGAAAQGKRRQPRQCAANPARWQQQNVGERGRRGGR
jgi:hypothetical protein